MTAESAEQVPAIAGQFMEFTSRQGDGLLRSYLWVIKKLVRDGKEVSDVVGADFAVVKSLSGDDKGSIIVVRLDDAKGSA